MAKKTVSKSELVDAVAEETGVKKKDVKEVMDVMLGKIALHLDRNYKVRLTGFGTFEVRKRKARTGVKPGTSQKITIPAGNYPVFKPGKNLRNMAGGPEGDSVTSYEVPKKGIKK